MELDDVVYLSLLTSTIVFGFFYRLLNDNELKKRISTAIGFTVVLFVSGTHVFHSIISIIVNALIILYTSKKSCHIKSFAFSFLYLIFFRTTEYFDIPYPPSHTNLVQMILTLKLVGLAFEVHDSYEENLKKTEKQEKALKKESFASLNFEDIFHYSYFYIGVLTGPYFSYKTFHDYFKKDFHKYAACESITWRKLILIPLYMSVFLVVTHFFPVKYAETDEFYTDTSFWYRLWYINPVFVSFRMRIYIGLILSEAACTMTGLGAYPAAMESKPGKGPSTNFDLIEALEKDPETKLQTKFDFETVHNIDTWYTETNPSVRASIRYWNMCVQYWMAYVVYKRFPIKSLRTAATFIVSAVWHGIYAGYYLCLCSAPLYLPIEDLWDVYRKEATGKMRIMLNVIYWVVRTQAFSYMGMAFSLLSMKNGLRYYRSVYYVYHITALIALVLGLALKKMKKKSVKSLEKLSTK